MSGEYQVHLQSGLTVFALIFDQDRTKLWNGTAFVAISSVADADWADGAVACAEQTTAGSTGTGIYVGDRPAGIESAGPLLVEFYSGTPTPGAPNWAIQFDNANTAGVVEAVTATQLKVEVADYLGYGRNSEGVGTAWSADVLAKLSAIVLSGARQFYWPPPLDGKGVGHRWSFLQPKTTLSLVTGTADYTLPAGFGGLIGRMYYSAGDDVLQDVDIVGLGAILRERQRDPDSSPPTMAAYYANESDGASAQTWTLAVGPGVPDGDYTLHYQFQATPSSIAGAYNLGGESHYETLLASCLAVAEGRYQDSDTSGRKEAYWLQRLAASVALDRRNAPDHLGPYGDKPDRYCRSRVSGYVTFGGVLYD